MEGLASGFMTALVPEAPIGLIKKDSIKEISGGGGFASFPIIAQEGMCRWLTAIKNKKIKKSNGERSEAFPPKL